MTDWVGVPGIPCQYPANLAGVPDGPCRGWEDGPGTLHRRIPYPPNLAGVPDALIFFCLLFFHQGKKRRKEDQAPSPYVGAYCIRPSDDPSGTREGTRRPAPVPEREQIRAFGFNHSILADRLWGVCFCALHRGLRPSTLFSFSLLDAPKYIGRNDLFFR